MKTSFHLFVVICCLLGALIGCQSDSKSEVGTLEYDAVSKELQPLYDEILVIHDEVMPELKTISDLQDKLSQKLDTLRQQDPMDSEALKSTNRMLGGLNRAENAMWAWMHEFSKLDSVPASDQAQFLSYEKSSALSMKDLMLSSIDSAKEYLNEHPISSSGN